MFKNFSFRILIFYLVLMGFIFSCFSISGNELSLNFLQRGGEIKKLPDIRIVMLGDSITFRTDWNRLLERDDIINEGVDGDTIEEIMNRLDSVIRLKPEICFVMGGINDISRGFLLNGIYKNYVSILQKLIKNNIKPVVQSTLVVSTVLYEAEAINPKIDELNNLLKDYTRENNIDFIDLNSTLSKKGGLMPVYTVDGVHLSKKGYEAWRLVLITFLNKLDLEKSDK